MHIESIQAIRLGPDGVLILAGEADLEASIGDAPRPGTLDPIGLQLAAVAASLMRAIETTALARGIRLDGVEMSVSAERDGHDGNLSRIGYRVVLRSDASPAEIEALHELVRQGDEICAVIGRAIRLEGGCASPIRPGGRGRTPRSVFHMGGNRSWSSLASILTRTADASRARSAPGTVR